MLSFKSDILICPFKTALFVLLSYIVRVIVKRVRMPTFSEIETNYISQNPLRNDLRNTCNAIDL